jgi:beta-1,4-mannosyl-glycoprotein beta-1,4-N-acetylglucosaminyltransferase
MKIFDCFLFRDELDLLELRLETHTFADVFLLIEAPRTFSNLSKPLVFQENKSRFQKFLPRLKTVVAADIPWPKRSGEALAKPDRVAINRHQWQYVMEGIEKAADDDVIMLSDLDEIARPLAIPKMKHLLAQHPYVLLRYEIYYYYLNGYRGYGWHGAICMTARTLRTAGVDVWHTFLKRKQFLPEVSHAGWHFSYLGGADRIAYKLAANAHTEFDKSQFKNPAYLKRMVEQGHLFQTDKPGLTYVPIDDSFPLFLTTNMQKFKKYIYPVILKDN